MLLKLRLECGKYNLNGQCARVMSIPDFEPCHTMEGMPDTEVLSGGADNDANGGGTAVMTKRNPSDLETPILHD